MTESTKCYEGYAGNLVHVFPDGKKNCYCKMATRALRVK